MIWIVLFVAVAARAGFWRSELTKEVIMWTFTTGLATLRSFPEASKPGYFLQAIARAVGVTVFVEYLVTLTPFPFWVEMMLQPVVFILAVVPVLNAESGDVWNRLNLKVSGVLSMILLTHTALTLYHGRQTTDWGLFILEALWPIALSLWILPFVFVVAVIAGYEQAFMRLNWARRGGSALKQKIGLLMALGLRLSNVLGTISLCTGYPCHQASR